MRPLIGLDAVRDNKHGDSSGLYDVLLLFLDTFIQCQNNPSSGAALHKYFFIFLVLPEVIVMDFNMKIQCTQSFGQLLPAKIAVQEKSFIMLLRNIGVLLGPQLSPGCNRLQVLED